MLIDVTLQDLVDNHDIVHGAALAGGAGYPLWHEAEPDEGVLETLPGTSRAPRGNPEIEQLDLERGIDKLERICGS